MARLGKKEREAKRSLIAGNLANLKNMERSSGTLGSLINTDRMLSRTHVGFRDAHNVKGVGSSGGGGKRFAGNLKHCDVARTIKVRDKTTGRMVTEQQVWLADERVWKRK